MGRSSSTSSSSSASPSRRDRPKPWHEVMDDAKKRHRPSLKDWSRDGFATRRAEDFLALASITPDPKATVGTGEIDVVECRDLSVSAFLKHYEEPCKPVLIRGVPKEEKWSARKNWRLPGMVEDDDTYQRYGFKCGEGDDGRSVRVRLPDFYEYMKHQQDDSPLYIFDSTYDDDKKASALLSDYRVPSYFPDDLFSLVGERRRPPYRWFLVGPKRSGTCVHVDPLGTSAWNTVITGRKRWVLFPPGTSKDLVKGKDLYRKGEDDEPINYFVDIVRRMRRKYGPEVTMYEFIQEPGDTIFVPGGWWHAVLNLEDSLAITQNFCSRTNFPTVWRKTRSGRKKMAVKWLELLEETKPDLAKKARRLNEEDGYKMMTREELNERKARKAKKKKEKREKKRRQKHDDQDPRRSHRGHREKEEEEQKKRKKHKDREDEEADNHSRPSSRGGKGTLHETSKEPENDRVWRRDDDKERHEKKSRKRRIDDDSRSSRKRSRSRCCDDDGRTKKRRERDRSRDRSSNRREEESYRSGGKRKREEENGW